MLGHRADMRLLCLPVTQSYRADDGSAYVAISRQPLVALLAFIAHEVRYVVTVGATIASANESRRFAQMQDTRHAEHEYHSTTGVTMHYEERTSSTYKLKMPRASGGHANSPEGILSVFYFSCNISQLYQSFEGDFYTRRRSQVIDHHQA